MYPVSLAREYSGVEVNWQRQYREAITNLGDLCDLLDLKPDQLPVSAAASQQFPLRVPRSYVQRMQKSNPEDPLLLQVLPRVHEETITAGFGTDPVGDVESSSSPGLLQKYHGRALLLVTGLCGIHCRYCFRRHFPYAAQNPRHDAWHQALHQIANDSSINEVILSGGDPLVLHDAKLASLVARLESIPHVQRLRLHTRLPVVIPARINSELTDWIHATRLTVVVVLHINHARELNGQLREKLIELSTARCMLLNQSVLLRHVNDTAEALIELSEALLPAHVLPYYLHLLDRVQGAAHFEVDETRARKIMREAASKLPGYLLPKLVKEEAGTTAKTLITY